LEQSAGVSQVKVVTCIDKL